MALSIEEKIRSPSFGHFSLKNKQQGTLTTSTEAVDKNKRQHHSILENFIMKLDLLIKKITRHKWDRG